MFILFRLVGISVVHPDFMPYMTPLLEMMDFAPMVVQWTGSFTMVMDG